jgi:hypothetical protein
VKRHFVISCMSSGSTKHLDQLAAIDQCRASASRSPFSSVVSVFAMPDVGDAPADPGEPCVREDVDTGNGGKGSIWSIGY